MKQLRRRQVNDKDESQDPRIRHALARIYRQSNDAEIRKIVRGVL